MKEKWDLLFLAREDSLTIRNINYVQQANRYVELMNEKFPTGGEAVFRPLFSLIYLLLDQGKTTKEVREYLPFFFPLDSLPAVLDYHDQVTEHAMYKQSIEEVILSSIQNGEINENLFAYIRKVVTPDSLLFIAYNSYACHLDASLFRVNRNEILSLFQTQFQTVNTHLPVFLFEQADLPTLQQFEKIHNQLDENALVNLAYVITLSLRVNSLDTFMLFLRRTYERLRSFLPVLKQKLTTGGPFS